LTAADKRRGEMDLVQKRKELLIVAFRKLLNTALAHSLIRSVLLKKTDKRLYELFVEVNPLGRPRRVQYDKYLVTRNLVYAVDKALKGKRISPKVRSGLLRVLLGNIFLGGGDKINAFREKYGWSPPGFLTISPGGSCNLHCENCYAGDLGQDFDKLDFDILDRIVTDKTESWGSFFTVISGGEPFMWKSQGKDILDIAAEHLDNYFLIYTNGTLIDEKKAERMADLGNVSPAISVEGYREETDARRGEGVHERILKAFENLRKVGVPFGVSLTATKDNAELLLSDEFIDFYFNQQGAVYGWIFQYMPIGCKFTLDLLISPEQRLNMFLREQKLIEEDKLFIADFWNSGAISDGCLCAGRSGGYFYIDWHGNIMPCVFTPYSTDNIIDVYKRGETLNDVLQSPFLTAVRKWQKDYGYMAPPDRVGNEITPCPIRDHHSQFYRILKEHNARPINPEAEAALESTEFVEGLTSYGERVARLTDGIWDKEYLEPERKDQPTDNP
jgi:MoaA/NifB/PqqE/SkfB family radical SAM enzyme